MAENKKSFVLYADMLKSIEHLTYEEKGILLTHLLEYVNDMNPVLTDRLILTAWKPIELQLKRDLIKFEQVRAKRSEAGKKSAELRALKSDEQEPTNPTSVEFVKQRSTNPTDNVNDNVNDNDIIINKRFFDSCMDSQEWIEQTAMASKPKFTPAEVIELLKKFQKDTELNADVKINANEYRSHFRRWLDKQTKIHVEFYDLPLPELTDYIARVVIDEKLYNGFSEVPPELKGYFDKMCKRLAQFIKANIDTVKNKSIADIMALEKKSNIGKL